MTQTNPGIVHDLYTSLKVRTSGDDTFNCQKNDDKDPPTGSRRRRGNIRVSANDSIWGINLPASLRASPRDKARKRRRSIVRTPKGMSGDEIQQLANLMRFITNNRAERVTLLQIAMTPFEVCDRSHNSLSHNHVVT